MPKAKLVFNLPEEQMEYNTTMHASDYYNVIWSVLQEMRKVSKYGTEGGEYNPEEADKWRQFIFNELGAHGLAEEF